MNIEFNSLFWKKMMMAFIVGAVPVFLLGVIDALDNFAKGGDNDWGILWSVLLALLSGSISAGIRGALAYFTNFMPTDKLHGPGDHPTSTTVTRNS